MNGYFIVRCQIHGFTVSGACAIGIPGRIVWYALVYTQLNGKILLQVTDGIPVHGKAGEYGTGERIDPDGRGGIAAYGGGADNPPVVHRPVKSTGLIVRVTGISGRPCSRMPRRRFLPTGMKRIRYLPSYRWRRQ